MTKNEFLVHWPFNVRASTHDRASRDLFRLFRCMSVFMLLFESWLTSPPFPPNRLHGCSLNDANFASSFHLTILPALSLSLHLVLFLCNFCCLQHFSLAQFHSTCCTTAHLLLAGRCRWPAPPLPPSTNYTSLHLNLCCTFLFPSWFPLGFSHSALFLTTLLLVVFFNSQYSLFVILLLVFAVLPSRVFPFTISSFVRCTYSNPRVHSVVA